MPVAIGAIEAAAERIRGQVVRTPLQHARTLSALTGAEIWLKFENQQFTASFKERGALNRLLALTPEECQRGVIASSAGNHAQAVAYHGHRLGIPTLIVMPRTAPNVKVEHTRAHGAEVLLHGEAFDDARAFAETLAGERGLTLVHPFDDDAVIAGQGTLALEMLEDGPPFDAVIAPIGGGGLLAGVATAVKARAPATRVIGVQSARYPAAYQAFHGLPAQVPGGSSVAEGIAEAQPAHARDPAAPRRRRRPRGRARTRAGGLHADRDREDGGGGRRRCGPCRRAVDPGRFAGRRVGLVLCGGNIDPLVLSALLERGLVLTHRLVRFHVELPDTPGALGSLAQQLGALRSNIVDIAQQRTFDTASVRSARVDLVLEMRGEEQAEQVLAALATAGFEARREPAGHVEERRARRSRNA